MVLSSDIMTCQFLFLMSLAGALLLLALLRPWTPLGWEGAWSKISNVSGRALLS